jgi:hypothetical protein
LKIVQSHWSKPAASKSSYAGNRFSGGWSHPKYLYYSCALSCLSLRNYYDKVELVTDAMGHKQLIENLALPYTSVEVRLDILNEYPGELFALGKLWTYRFQKEPFIHVDNDIFIWSRFPGYLEKADLIGQNQESNFSHDLITFSQIMPLLKFVPESFYSQADSDSFLSANAGIFGGHNLEFLHNYVDKAFAFVDENLASFKNFDRITFLNTIFEQYYFTQLAEEANVNITYLFSDLDTSNYDRLIEYAEVPANCTYIHTIGNFKKERIIELAVENWLLQLAPEYYYRINSLFKNE